jgi:hypothetical protein
MTSAMAERLAGSETLAVVWRIPFAKVRQLLASTLSANFRSEQMM